MSLNKFLGIALLLAISSANAATLVACPAYSSTKHNTLVSARLFDGPVSENAELAPDNEAGATWDVSGYKNTGRPLLLVCDYKDKTSVELTIPKSASRCAVKGKKKVTVKCY